MNLQNEIEAATKEEWEQFETWIDKKREKMEGQSDQVPG